MAILKQFNLLFIHIPKNGGTAIINTLGMEMNGHYRWDTHPYFNENFYKFSTIRNPWARVVSAYNYARLEQSYWHSIKNCKHPDYDLLKNLTFEEHINLLIKNKKIFEHGWDEQSTFVYDNNDNLKVNKLIRLENLNIEINQMFNELNLPLNINIPIINSSASTDYKKYYTNTDLIDKVAYVYKRDINNLKYTYEN
jgi:hypothetical protein